MHPIFPFLATSANKLRSVSDCDHIFPPHTPYTKTLRVTLTPTPKHGGLASLGLGVPRFARHGGVPRFARHGGLASLGQGCRRISAQERATKTFNPMVGATKIYGFRNDCSRIRCSQRCSHLLQTS